VASGSKILYKVTGEQLIGRLDGLPRLPKPSGYLVFAAATTIVPKEPDAKDDDPRFRLANARFRLENEDGDEAKARLGRMLRQNFWWWWPWSADVRFSTFGTVALTLAFPAYAVLTSHEMGAPPPTTTFVSLFCEANVDVEIERWTITALAVDSLKMSGVP
jgi:hypothetical protein